MKVFLSKVYYRTRAAIDASLTKGGTYPNYTFSGYTALVGTVAALKLPNQGDGEEPSDGGATTYASGMQVPVELTVAEFSVANYNTLKSALHNQLVDIIAIDPDQPTVAYGVYGVRLTVGIEVESGAEPKIIIKGTRKYAGGATTPPWSMLTVS